MGAIKPWHLLILLSCFLAVAALATAIGITLAKRRK